jgi:hypothetical protein
VFWAFNPFTAWLQGIEQDTLPGFLFALVGGLVLLVGFIIPVKFLRAISVPDKACYVIGTIGAGTAAWFAMDGGELLMFIQSLPADTLVNVIRFTVLIIPLALVSLSWVTSGQKSKQKDA